MWDASALSSYGNAGTEGTLAWTLGGAGAALLVGGALRLVLRGPGERVPVRTARVLMAPASGGHGAWLGIGGEL
jgi:hypothetical protein